MKIMLFGFFHGDSGNELKNTCNDGSDIIIVLIDLFQFLIAQSPSFEEFFDFRRYKYGRGDGN